MKTKKLNNKTMNQDVYSLRRKVISLIHEAKRLYPGLPRITVRITDDRHDIAGIGRLGKNVIWITERFAASRAVVFHEIIHAAFGIGHVEGCKLMSPFLDRTITHQECDELFLRYAIGSESNKHRLRAFRR